MAVLISIGHDGWYTEDQLAEELRAVDPGADIRPLSAPGNLEEVTMLAVSALKGDLPARLPNLQLVQKLGAGVETIVAHPGLAPHVRIARLKPQEPAQEIAEYCLAYVLRGQRNMAAHAAAQARCAWQPLAPKRPADTTVGVLGLGHIGGRTARLMRDMRFRVLGWSRSPKEIEGVGCRHGEAALPQLLRECDYVCSILPSTPATRGLMNAEKLAAMKPGATLINAGRGDLVDEPALLAALNAGTPGQAVLDVVRQEPLPADSPLWTHPRVTITPHVSGWHLGGALRDVVENYRRLHAGEPLLHEVDRQRGY
ncbi:MULTISPECIES: 2-hydroxyacid dehydrogenase [Leisingera]|jgi:glyoxylate/hydroxypyruvate reductase A|uniref:2-hydroxyacid dehydrogenase n=1 Tax=Leisingera TaxID=191028 RepID=UPI001154E572|nr:MULTISPECIES: glyoxylate/hydroxypyruvate reductase A [Leisingera]QDI74965.1 glyoxylate/hydroxypyruvate reductase A [Leisingera aquaemixtae]